MTSSAALNSEIYNLRDRKGLDLISKIRDDLKDDINYFSYLGSISKENYIIYILAGLVIVLVWQRLHIAPNTLVGIVIALIAIYTYNERQRNTTSDVNRDLMTQLETLDILTGEKHLYIYLEPDLIRFWSEFIEFRKYATDAFDRSLRLADLYMNLYHDVEAGSRSCSADIDVAEDLRKKLMNTWNEIDFNLPSSDLIRTRHGKSMDRLLRLLLRLFGEMQSYCTERPLSEFHIEKPSGADFRERSDYHVLH